jgi:phosphoglycolate phosphatase
MARQFDLIVYDWDGTLVDSTTMIAQCIQKSAADLGLKVPSLEQASHVIGLGLADALSLAVPDLDSRRAAEFSERYRFHYFACEPDIVLFDGVRELLHEQSQSVPLAVATGKSRRGLARAFEATGLGALFASSRCADETHSKPHPAMLLELGAELGVAPQRMLMIGDTTHDLAMAKAAGASAIGVTYGAHPRDKLLEYTPLLMAESVADLRAWLTTNG